VLEPRVYTNSGLNSPVLLVDGKAVALVWKGREADRSASCVELGTCVHELFVKRIGLDGNEGPTRQLTTLARPKPYVPEAKQWRERCEAQLGAVE
jgi:hypothetical protein